MIIEQRIAMIAADAKALRRRGYAADADRLDQIVTDLTTDLAALVLVPEKDAMLVTGRRRAWLLDRFGGWRDIGAACYGEDAGLTPGVRYYRRCVLPAPVIVSHAA